MNNPLATHGAQVHNIQIKPISATKRRAGGPQNLMQAQFHNSNGPVQSSQTNSTSGTVGNILNRSSKEKAQFSQTSVLNSSKDIGINQAKQPSNKLISQYLAQVNNKNSGSLGINNTSSSSINN